MDTSITGQHVTRYLNKAMLFRDRPKEFFSDNGPEFTSNALNAWAYEKHIEHVSIPGNPCITVSLKASMGSFGSKDLL